MRKPAINFFIDALAFIAFLLLASTGFLIHFTLPARSGKLTVWGMNRHEWGEIHFWIAIAFISFIVIHLILHWNWITNMIASKKKSRKVNRARIIIAVIAVLIILMLVIAPFFSSVDYSGYP